jgi:hypothetical protein
MALPSHVSIEFSRCRMYEIGLIYESTDLAATHVKGMQIGTTGVESLIVKVGELLCDCLYFCHCFE